MAISVTQDFREKLNVLPEKYFFSTETPVEKALYEPRSLFYTPKEKANEYLLQAVKYSFKHHYGNNSFYHQICKENNVTPDDIKSIDDFKKIPLLPHEFFKDYPSGKDFATWLVNVMTGEIPKIVIEGKKPSYDDVIDAFQKAGITVCYSSGTTGKFTFIPRDKKTYLMGQYAIARCSIEMLYDWYNPDSNGYLLFPNPNKTNIYVGKVTAVLLDLVKDTRAAIDRKITTDILRISMGIAHGFKEKMMSKLAKSVTKKMNEKMVQEIMKWTEDMDRKKERIVFAGAPFILNMVMNELEKEGKSYDFGERGAVLTGGGWKIYEDKRMPVEAFRKKVNEIFGIPHEQCLDLYAMVEGNGFMVHCPEGHYLHVPHTYYHPMVLDENNEPVGYGEEGKFAFLDSLAMSYPGFIITGDKVKLHERCPACDRETPVLEPEVKRIAGAEIRGCAEEMRRIMMGR